MLLPCHRGFDDQASPKAMRAAAKLKRHQRLWDLAHRLLRETLASTDPAFADRYTAVAFTKDFEGSPHIDTQNNGPFYGLALGDFHEGGGALCVECSAREVAHVDTRGRLARVDGRRVHWVRAFRGGERYSLILYNTEGDDQA